MRFEIPDRFVRRKDRYAWWDIGIAIWEPIDKPGLGTFLIRGNRPSGFGLRFMHRHVFACWSWRIGFTPLDIAKAERDYYKSDEWAEFRAKARLN